MGTARDFLPLILLTWLSMMPSALAVTVVGAPQQVGTLSSAVLAEVSGIAGSHSMPSVLWAHADSGDGPQFYSISTAGALLGTFPLTGGATAVDWEDMAIGPKTGGGSFLYFGDIGDNAAARPDVTVYRVNEPETSGGASIDASQYTAALLQYVGGARDAESLFVDPWTDELYIITKTSIPQVHRAPAAAFGSPTPTTLESLGNLAVSLSSPTAADISPDGRHILIRNYSTTGYLFERGVGQTVWDALQGPGIPVTLASDIQNEAIGWAADGKGFYTTSERFIFGARPLFYYAVTFVGDLDDDGYVDAQDIDLLWQIVRGDLAADPGNNDSEDFSGDGLVNEDDVDYLLAHLLDAGPGRSYGDADLDGGVGGLDYTAWRLRAVSGWAGGDFDGDGGVGGLDYTLWRTRPTAYPSTVGPHSSVSTVPEPATVVLLTVAIPAFYLLTRRPIQGSARQISGPCRRLRV